MILSRNVPLPPPPFDACTHALALAGRVYVPGRGHVGGQFGRKRIPGIAEIPGRHYLVPSPRAIDSGCCMCIPRDVTVCLLLQSAFYSIWPCLYQDVLQNAFNAEDANARAGA